MESRESINPRNLSPLFLQLVNRRVSDPLGFLFRLAFFHLGLFYDSVLGALPLTYTEQVEVATPEKYRYPALLEASPHDAGLTPEQELTYLLNKKFAEQKITPRVTNFDEWGNPIGGS